MSSFKYKLESVEPSTEEFGLLGYLITLVVVGGFAFISGKLNEHKDDKRPPEERIKQLLNEYGDYIVPMDSEDLDETPQVGEWWTADEGASAADLTTEVASVKQIALMLGKMTNLVKALRSSGVSKEYGEKIKKVLTSAFSDSDMTSDGHVKVKKEVVKWPSSPIYKNYDNAVKPALDADKKFQSELKELAKFSTKLTADVAAGKAKDDEGLAATYVTLQRTVKALAGWYREVAKAFRGIQSEMAKISVHYNN